MANKTTSVVTTTGGSPELVDDGKTGFIVPTKDAKALAGAMNMLIEDRSLITTFSEAAQQKLAREFNAEQTVKNHINFFESLIQ